VVVLCSPTEVHWCFRRSYCLNQHPFIICSIYHDDGDRRIIWKISTLLPQ